MLAASDPAAQLVQLGYAVAVGVLDQHHGGVGDVDADLDHGRRDEDLRAPGGEGRHRVLFLGRAHLSVHEHQLVAGQRAGLQALVLRRGGASLERF